MTASEGSSDLGSRLRALRQAAELSQEKLAARADLSAATIRRIELDQLDPNLATLRAIARALGVGLAELVEEEEPA
ncbi:MAG TPA: helix-turn-helix transcriptional regulator [Acidimicrobiales bacterium]|jgi:transcriptional regulator with XRE-family HTH domain|nr:helix-turn-helix transcriptional regulator [Acidimicrobiales bacterium]